MKKSLMLLAGLAMAGSLFATDVSLSGNAKFHTSIPVKDQTLKSITYVDTTVKIDDAVKFFIEMKGLDLANAVGGDYGVAVEEFYGSGELMSLFGAKDSDLSLDFMFGLYDQGLKDLAEGLGGFNPHSVGDVDIDEYLRFGLTAGYTDYANLRISTSPERLNNKKNDLLIDFWGKAGMIGYEAYFVMDDKAAHKAAASIPETRVGGAVTADFSGYKVGLTGTFLVEDLKFDLGVYHKTTIENFKYSVGAEINNLTNKSSSATLAFGFGVSAEYSIIKELGVYAAFQAKNVSDFANTWSVDAGVDVKPMGASKALTLQGGFQMGSSTYNANFDNADGSVYIKAAIAY